MLVIKFGGSSVGSVINIEKVKNILNRKKEPFILVVSAFQGVTDYLNQLAGKALSGDYIESLEMLRKKYLEFTRALLRPSNQTETIITIQQNMLQLEDICHGIHSLGELSEKTLARVLGNGEQLSSVIIYEYLKQEGIAIEYLSSEELITANDNYLEAEVDYVKTYKQIENRVNKSTCYIAAGFIASNSRNERVVLGRGGSDYTAALFAGALNAASLELWSDVSGMLNANPNLVRAAESIERMSYKEAFEMAYFGAKVVYPPAIRPVMQKGIPVYLKNTNNPEDSGTLIHESNYGASNKIIGVSTLSDIAVLTISGVGLAGNRGVARRVFQAMEESSINIIFITQACSEQSICLGIKAQHANEACFALEKQFSQEMKDDLVNQVEVDDNQVVLAVVGDNMKHQAGLSGKIFGSLGENNISVRAIAQGASERNISIVIDAKDEHKAVNVIHERFFQSSVKKVHIFVIGIGNVGSQFLNILEKQQIIFKEKHHIELKLMGIANSTRYKIDKNGLEISSVRNPETWDKYNSISEFIEKIKELNLRNSIFIDNTASEVVSQTYAQLFSHSISVVTCNKIAGSSPYKNYASLISLAKEKNCHFQYETSVGAALPVIKTIQDLKHSGDHINRIEAVLSGSLNFIFNNYDAKQSFSEVVRQAQKEGYTEPNPKNDLTGLDVMRKILILARESGFAIELDDIVFKGFLPESCCESNEPDEFFESLNKEEAYFANLYQQAKQNNRHLKVVAVMENGSVSVSLRNVDASSPFYHLDGKDNIVALFTDRYTPEPLIIKGAGAGAEVTASGVFSDLIYIVNR